MKARFKRCLRLLIKPRYPKELLPTPIHKLIIGDFSSRCIIRYFEEISNTPILNEAGEIDLKYISSPREHIIDLSTALLGNFKPEHFKYQITKEGAPNFLGDWPGDIGVKIPKFPAEFIILEEYKNWGIEVQDIDGKTMSFTTGVGATLTEHIIECLVVHTPTLSNYWHFSVRWLLDGVDVFVLREKGSIPKNQISKLSREVRKFMKDHIKLVIPKASKLKKEEYLR